VAAGAGAQDRVPPEAQVVTGTSAVWRKARRWLEKQRIIESATVCGAVSACTMTLSFQRRAFRTVPCFRVSFFYCSAPYRHQSRTLHNCQLYSTLTYTVCWHR
jgi:hypothetical protein